MSALEKAFPYNEKNYDGSHVLSHEGMTLRDYFAAKFAAGIYVHSYNGDEDTHLKELAISAYEMADAMLEAVDQILEVIKELTLKLVKMKPADAFTIITAVEGNMHISLLGQNLEKLDRNIDFNTERVKETVRAKLKSISEHMQ